ncbi:ligand-binding sensor domain-containing protein [Tenacibaculum lutimaris]|uniref:Ligand-binding sensor domain-containing protein n=1 Tax=Tenacibaculum lutimaris TaxID=285258 RepID=A0A420E0M5_9FLAO|nr:two-component regulator propeller domain-containing protein [Tenacibaculum lutimaris]RKF03665.1 ligand-binding sensor domain-containing protein [Tenacibaculum lutimaris]
MRTKLFFLFFIVVANSLGQSLKFKTLTTKEGLSNNSVNDIISDDKGRLWVATWDGLNRYDGNNFKIFKHVDNDTTSLPGNVIYALQKDTNGSLWCLTDNNSVSKLHKESIFQNFSFKDTPVNFRFSKKRNLVVETKNSKYYEFDGTKFTEIEANQVFNKEPLVHEQLLLNEYPEVVINESYQDRKGNIWYATRKNGLYVIRNNQINIHDTQIEHYTYDLYNPYSFTSNEIEKIYEDNFENIWLGHKDGGLSMAYIGSEYINTIAPHPINYKHLPNETVRAITKDKDNNLWLGYYTEGLYKYSKSEKCFVKKQLEKAKENQEWERIRSLYTAKDGSIWVGTYAGLIRIKESEISYYSADEFSLLPANRIYAMTETDDNRIWFACWGGLAVFNLKENKFEEVPGVSSLKKYHIRDVVASGNELALATENYGMVLFSIADGSKHSVTTAEGLTGNSVYSIAKDKSTEMYWVATLGGVTVYDREKGVVATISENEGLPSHMVYSVIPKGNYIWVSTTKGIASINKEDYKVNVSHPEEGWQAPEFSEGAYYQDSKGVLYFGGINGVNYFAPELITFNKKTPELVIEVDGIEGRGDLIEKTFSENNISLEITSVAYRKNHENVILYRLKGFDKDWRVYGTSPVLYKKLQPGEYILEVKNSLSTSEEELTSIPVIIKPPFYKTSWFLWILVSGGIGLIIFGFGYKVRKDKIYKEKLKQKISERTAIIERQKKDLIKANAKLEDKNREIFQQKEEVLALHHKLKNEDFEIDKFKTFVLAEFKKPLMQLLQESQDISIPEEIQTRLIRQTQTMVDALMEWDFLEQVHHVKTTEASAIEINDVLHELTKNLERKLIQSGINLSYQIPGKKEWITINLLQFKLLFKYVFNDLIKYSNQGSTIEVVYILKDTSLELKVDSDSSVLLNNIESLQRYSPYYNAAKELLLQLKGKITVNPDGGRVSIEVEVPFQKTSSEKASMIQWNHLGMIDELPTDKHKVLVLSSEVNYGILQSLLGNEAYHLIFESNVDKLFSALSNLNIDSIIFYDVKLTNEVVQFLENRKENKKTPHCPILYLSDEIGHSQIEQVTKLGLDVTVQLPVSKTFLQAKLENLLNSRKPLFTTKSISNTWIEKHKDEQLLSPNEKLVKKALTYMHECLHDHTFNIESLQEKLEISRVKCYRVFKEILKQSPSDVLINLRLQKAQHLLNQNILNISEISFECGFANPKYFSRQFKKHFNMSPKAYKDQKIVA